MGSNEVSPIVQQGNDNGFYVSWKNEKTNNGIHINKLGSVDQEQESLNSRDFLFFRNGVKLNLWSKYLLDGNKEIGFTLLGNSSDTIKTVSLAIDSNPKFSINNASIINSNQVVISYNTNDSTYIVNYNNNGDLIKKVSLEKLDNLKMFASNDFIYLMNVDLIEVYKLHKFDLSLNLLLTKSFSNNFFVPYLYLGNSNFLCEFYEDSGMIPYSETKIMKDCNSVIKSLDNMNFGFITGETKIKNINDSLFMVSGGFNAYIFNKDGSIFKENKPLFNLQNHSFSDFDNNKWVISILCMVSKE